MPGEEFLEDHGISKAEIRRIAAYPSAVIDGDARLVFVSRPLEQVFGFSAEAVLGQGPPHPWWPPEDREQLTHFTRQFLAGGFVGLHLVQPSLIVQCQDGRRLQVTTEYECWPADPPVHVLHVAITTRVEGAPTAPGELLERVRRNLADLLSCVDALEASSQGAASVPGLDRLTPREREVLADLLAGTERGEIARLRAISENTVRNHVRAIYRKLGAHSRADLVRMLASSGIAARPHRPTPPRERELER